jgi:hypothetical protein
MNEQRNRAVADREGKRLWCKPALSRIEAGHAEVGTRLVPDGAFTTS